MATKKLTGLIKLINNNLSFELEKIKGYDNPVIKKTSFKNEVHSTIYTIEVNDNSFMYVNKAERDKDCIILKELIK